MLKTCIFNLYLIFLLCPAPSIISLSPLCSTTYNYYCSSQKNENTMYLHCQPPLTMSQLCCLSYVSRMGPIYGLKNLRYLYKSPAAKIFSQNYYSTTTTTTSTTPSAGGTGRVCLARWLAAIICACIWCLWFMFRGFAKFAFGDTCLNTTKKHTWSPYRTHTRITCDVSIYINISLLVCFSWMSMVFAHTIYAF